MEVRADGLRSLSHSLNAEVFWMTFRPAMKPDSHWYITKLGQPIDPDDVVSRGARTLHGVNGSLGYSDTDLRLDIASLDVSLVAPGRRSLLDFHNELQDIADGVHFNCYNNVWGTNFPMWYEDNAQFRFIITVED